jgi:AmmeMemoRadiSam system protein A
VAEQPDQGVPTPEEGAALVTLAVRAMAARLAGQQIEPGVPGSERLTAPGASFVTLERNGRLRGCIGTIAPRRPLYLDVVRNALLALADPRLPRVTTADWPELDVKVSVLTRPEPIPVADPDTLVHELRPGVDGLLLAGDDDRRATFLPSVWGKVPDPAQFLAALLEKGGWSGWPDGMQALRYTSIEFVDPAPRAALH